MFHRIIRTLELYDGLRLPVRVAGVELLLVHDDGKTWLIQSRCPHGEFPLERATVHRGVLRCPGHGLEFSLDSGRCPNQSYQLRRYRIDYEGPWLGVWVADGD